MISAATRPLRLVALLILLALTACKEPQEPQAGWSVVRNEAGGPIAELYWVQLPEAPEHRIRIVWPEIPREEDDRNILIYYNSALMLGDREPGVEEGDDDVGYSFYSDITNDFTIEANGRPETLDALFSELGAKLSKPAFQSVALTRNLYRRGKRNHRPRSQQGRLLHLALHWNSPLRDANLQTLRSLESYDPTKIAPEAFKRFHTRHIMAIAPQVYGVGPQSADQIAAGLKTMLGDASRALPKRKPHQLVKVKPKRLLFLDPNRQSSRVLMLGTIGSRPHGFTTADDAGEELTPELFSELLSSPLSQALRQQAQANYLAELDYVDYAFGVQVLRLSYDIAPEQLARSVGTSMEIFRQFRQHGPSRQALDLAVQRKLNHFRHRDRIPEQVMPEASAVARFHFEDDYPLKKLDRIRAEGETGLDAFLKRYWPTAEEFMIAAFASNAQALAGACVVTDLKSLINCMEQ